MNLATRGSTRHKIIVAVMFVAAAACYVGIVTIRQGPAPLGDTTPLTSVSSALSLGEQIGRAHV